jgi:hypothetical protein
MHETEYLTTHDVSKTGGDTLHQEMSGGTDYPPAMTNFQTDSRKDRAMPTVAGYDVVLDGSIALGAGAGQDPDRDLALTFDPAIDVAESSVLCYVLNPGSAGITFDMSIVNTIGSTPITTFTAPPHIPYVMQEIIAANVLMTSGNTLHIEVTAGDGRFRDMLLLHKSIV